MLHDEDLQCPSTRADSAGATVFAVVGGTPDRPRVAYLDELAPLTSELTALAAPLPTTEVFRLAAPCAGRHCSHFDTGEGRCNLVTKVVRWLPVVVERLPRCAIRGRCVWWRQEGVAACRRCPQIVTDAPLLTAPMHALADPGVA